MNKSEKTNRIITLMYFIFWWFSISFNFKSSSGDKVL